MHDLSMPDLQTFFFLLSFFLSFFLFSPRPRFRKRRTMKSPKTKSEIRRARTPRDSSRYESLPWKTARVFSICIYTVSRPKDPPFSISFSAENIFRAATCFKALKREEGWKGGGVEGGGREREVFFFRFNFPRFSSFFIFKSRISQTGNRIISPLFCSFPRFSSSVILDLREYTYPRAR